MFFLAAMGMPACPGFAQSNLPPTIIIQPSRDDLATGDSALLSAAIDGAAPFGFQWLRDGTNFPGGTLTNIPYSTLVYLPLSNAQPAATGDYSVLITNAYGAVTSAPTRVLVSARARTTNLARLPGPLFTIYSLDFPACLAMDSSSNLCLAGSYSYPSNDDNSFHGCILAKWDPNGNQLWTTNYSLDGVDLYTSDMALDGAQNICIVGSAYYSNAFSRLFAARFDRSGSLLWSYQATNGADFAWQIAVDQHGNSYIAGELYGTNDYSPHYSLTKLDPAGHYLWGTNALDADFSDAFGVALDHLGGIYVTGYGGTRKFDTNGNLLWENPTVPGGGIKVDSNNFVYVLRGDTTDAQNDMSKLDGNGQLVWAANVGTGGASEWRDFALTPDGSTYLTGNDVRYDTPNWSRDIVTAKFSPDGQKLWSTRLNKPIGLGNSIVAYKGLALDATGAAYITGYDYYQPLDVDALWITAKYDRNGNQVWVSENELPSHFLAGSSLIIDAATNVIVAGTDGREDSVNTLVDYVLLRCPQTQNPGSPAILSGPPDQRIFAGSNATLSITASGTPLNYQWRYFGTDISGATNATLSLPSVWPTNGGMFSVRVENDSEATVSPEAELAFHTQLLSPAWTPGGPFRFTLIGDAGHYYDLQSSTNLMRWDSFGVIFNQFGMTNLDVPFPAAPDKAFFRAAEQ